MRTVVKNKNLSTNLAIASSICSCICKSYEDVKLISCFVCSKSRRNFVVVEHRIIEKCIIEAQFTCFQDVVAGILFLIEILRNL